jgi:hypothetical protein
MTLPVPSPSKLSFYLMIHWGQSSVLQLWQKLSLWHDDSEILAQMMETVKTFDIQLDLVEHVQWIRNRVNKLFHYLNKRCSSPVETLQTNSTKVLAIWITIFFSFGDSKKNIFLFLTSAVSCWFEFEFELTLESSFIFELELGSSWLSQLWRFFHSVLLWANFFFYWARSGHDL